MEHEGYVEAQNANTREIDEMNGVSLLESILNRDNLNRSYKRLKENKGNPGIDGMIVEEAQLE